MQQIRIRVSGRVQGVGFRYFTYQYANKLGVTGYVKNLDNGDVDIVAQGDERKIDQLIQWINQGGPASAHITNVAVTRPYQQEKLTSFNVRY